jgi:hypothetical protein
MDKTQRPLRKGLILASAALNIAIFLTVWFVFLNGIARREGGMLAISNLRSLRYFTLQSNLLEAVASVIMCFEMLSILRGARQRPKKWKCLLKLASTAAVSVTFFVVVSFLGPIFGFASMYRGANLWFHLIVPLVSILEYVFCEYLNDTSFRGTFWCAAPVAVYGVYYVGNILINGIGEWPDRNDFYGFLMWGVPIGAAIFLALILLGWFAGVLLRAGNTSFAGFLDRRAKNS